MAKYVNEFDLDVPLVRISDGMYMFGTKKITAKIMNDKLVVRVGGGYMRIDEFLATYGQQELDKLRAQMARQSNAGYVPNAVGSPKGRGSAQGRASPTGRR